MKNYILLTIVVTLIPLSIHSYNSKDEVISKSVSNPVKMLANNELSITEENSILIRLKNPKTNEVDLIELEEYIIGVVSAEMPASFNIEALKAQAIAARTYALVKMNSRVNKNYDLEDSTNDQAFITIEEMQQRWGNSFKTYYKKVEEAVKTTKGQVVTYNNEIVPTYYFAISNGNTQNVQSVFGTNESYLHTVESRWDNSSIKSYKYQKSYSVTDFKNIFNIKDKTINIKNIKKNDANYVEKITINNVTYTGNAIRKKLGLRSNDFTITISNNKVTIITYGYGHGVGMSQYGANGMANDGYNYEEIIKYYYQNVEIAKL